MSNYAYIESEGEREVRLYNQAAHASGVANEAKVIANTYTLHLMIEHLYFVHKMGVREISHILRIKQKEVKSVIKRAKEANEVYLKRKAINEEIMS
jgi:DNA-binding transcriptional regulator LsrR (DeoR family)